MVDSRAKGSRAEAAAKEILKKYTGLGWERTPGSGALDAKHALKGDLYIPKEKNLFTVEVKHYKDSQLNHLLLTGKKPMIIDWWSQAVREGGQNGNEPILLFKHDRSKWFVAFDDPPRNPDNYRFMVYDGDDYIIHIAMLEDWLEHEEIRWIK